LITGGFTDTVEVVVDVSMKVNRRYVISVLLEVELTAEAPRPASVIRDQNRRPDRRRFGFV